MLTRQAQRYRRLSEQIRRTEARLMEARWREALAEVERVAGELREAERAVAAHAVAGLPRNPRHDALPLSPRASIERGQAGPVVGLRRGNRNGSRQAIWFPRTWEILGTI